MAEKKQSKPRRRNRKTGKFVPLVWIATGAVIAFFISYSNTLFQGNNRAAGTNSVPAFAQTNQTNIGILERIGKLISPVKATNIGKTNPTQFLITNRIIPGTTNATHTNAQNIKPLVDEKIKLYLFLIKQKSDTVRIVPQTVNLSRSGTLLKDVLETLLRTREEQELLNLIPLNTKIHRVWLKDRVAYIDFNDAFAFNSYGKVGYQAQVYQVVFTATQFSSIDAVYFYINGKPATYLGGDGYLLDNPIYPFSSLPEFSIN